MIEKSPSAASGGSESDVAKERAADIINRFHALYYEGMGGHPVWKRTYWMGVPVSKCPLDMWIYQEILHEMRPDLLIETGTFMGGSALYFAHIFDQIGHGRIISVDIETLPRPAHPRIQYLHGSSADPQIVEQIRASRNPDDKTMVVLDSDHSAGHVYEELRLLSPFVSSGHYLVVEDSNVNGRPVLPQFGPGPYEAVQTFLSEHANFSPDFSREKFMMTWNPDCWLKRMA